MHLHEHSYIVIYPSKKKKKKPQQILSPADYLFHWSTSFLPVAGKQPRLQSQPLVCIKNSDISCRWLCTAIQACLHHQLALCIQQSEWLLFSRSNDKAVCLFFPSGKALILFSVANSDVKKLRVMSSPWARATVRYTIKFTSLKTNGCVFLYSLF